MGDSKGVPARFITVGDTAYVACADIQGWFNANYHYMPTRYDVPADAELVQDTLRELAESFGISWLRRDINNGVLNMLGGENE